MKSVSRMGMPTGYSSSVKAFAVAYEFQLRELTNKHQRKRVRNEDELAS